MLKSRLPMVAAEMSAKVLAAIHAGAELVAQEAQARVPVATGDLRNSIHVDVDGDDVRVVAGDTDTFYGHLVEFGATHTPARPFLVPSLESRREGIIELVERALKDL